MKKLIINSLLGLISIVLFVGCCATVPKEAITLSETLGRDLSNIQSSYQTIIRNQYSKMRDDIELFVRDKYTPYILRTVIEEKNVISNIKNKVDSGNYNDALNYTSSFTKAALKRIDIFRDELLDPIDSQERALLEKIDDAFLNMRNANATITAHLKSIRKVQGERELILDRAGLLDLKNKILDETVGFSNELNALLEKTNISDESSVKDIINGIKNLTKKE